MELRAPVTIPWFRRRFTARRQLDRIFLDLPDFLWRAATGRRHWPPYSLRAFVGGAQGFDAVGRWFLTELRSLGLFAPGTRILDIGCGCGRLAFALAADPDLCALEVQYTGMDVDAAVVRWCTRHITPLNRRFRFYHADCYNPSYNPGGQAAASTYRFPHPPASFDLVLLTSVLTHVLEDELVHYLTETARLLAPGGTAYASFFLYEDPAEAAAGMKRHGIAFPFAHQHHAVNREDYPTNAVAYQESFVREIVQRAGLERIGPTRYGTQDVLLLRRP